MGCIPEPPLLPSKMGKRSTSTTKGGKFMNPTDQARKEARKRELKKNKKQRQVPQIWFISIQK